MAKKMEQQKFGGSIFRQAEDLSENWRFEYQSDKTDMVQIFGKNFSFSGINFQDYFEKFEFLLSFCRKFGAIYF